jgi:hypothetical protein
MISKFSTKSSLLKPVGAIALAFFALLIPGCQYGAEEPYEEREGVYEEREGLGEEREGLYEEED